MERAMERADVLTVAKGLLGTMRAAAECLSGISDAAINLIDVDEDVIRAIAEETGYRVEATLYLNGRPHVIVWLDWNHAGVRIHIQGGREARLGDESLRAINLSGGCDDVPAESALAAIVAMKAPLAQPAQVDEDASSDASVGETPEMVTVRCQACDNEAGPCGLCDDCYDSVMANGYAPRHQPDSPEVTLANTKVEPDEALRMDGADMMPWSDR